MPRSTPSTDEFAEFVRAVEPGLRQALIATYGAVDGREATLDALSWAWENWDRLVDVEHAVGYLYRVGQSATRRFAARHLPLDTRPVADARMPDIDPRLAPALNRLPSQQRTCVLLVSAFGWRQTEVAELLGISPPTVRTHLRRAFDRLRTELEVHNAS